MNFVLQGVVAASLLLVVNSNERRHGKKGDKITCFFSAFWVGGQTRRTRNQFRTT